MLFRPKGPRARLIRATSHGCCASRVPEVTPSPGIYPGVGPSQGGVVIENMSESQVHANGAVPAIAVEVKSPVERDLTADDRDLTSDAHARAADARDERAEARDTTAEARESAAGKADAGVVSDRAEAVRDRRGAARDRAHAADDRQAAWSDRAVAAGDRAISSIDGLTRAHRRDAGVLELEREIERAKRTDQPFVVAFIDVDGLKAKNDTLGHAAGDKLLSDVANSIRGHLRSYDLIVRFGGDEFVCGLANVDVEAAAKRFSLVNVDLLATQHASITVGFAELTADDSLEDLLARADANLYQERNARKS